MSLFMYILLFASSWARLEATIQKGILTYINDLRHLHSAGPVISSPAISALAQKAAERFSKNGGVLSVIRNTQFNTNQCVFKGRLSRLPKSCVVSWYTTLKDHSWCKPERDGKARPFVNMIWNETTRAGIGVSQGKSGKYFVVAYFSPRKTHDVKGNVKPVKTVCPSGYSRFGSSCFKFHPEKATWEQAVIQCASENATLTSVRNRKEEEFLVNLQKKGKGNGWMWIGLHDRLHEGQFVWLDGLDFAPGVCAPVATNGGTSQNCVAWSSNKPLGCWSDKLCNERYSFMCRMPIEGKLTYRVEILFEKFRWNPNFRNKLSKAFKDLKLGMKVTFNEVFQRSSGRIGGGLRGIKITAVRPFSMQGRRRGTAVTLSLQFRSALADPTLKFQKFLRPSERLISITVDSPAIHKSSLSRTQCFFPCRNQSHSSCPTSSNTGYPNTGYHYTGYHTGYHNNMYHTGYHTGYQYNPCPTACTHYTYSCPTYCSQYCCSQGKQRKSSSSKMKPTNSPTHPATSSTAAVNTGTPKTSAPATKAPTQAPVQYNAQNTGYTPYQPYNQCNTCHLYSSPYCYTYCDEACCKHGNKKKDLHETLADMRENLKKFQAIVKLGKNSDLPGFEDADFEGNAVPLFGSKAKLAVKTLKRNIEKLEAKIKSGEKHFANKNNDFQGKNQEPRNNTLPDFDDVDDGNVDDVDDELSDLADEFDLDRELLELEEPKTKTYYPHMRVHSDNKIAEHENAAQSIDMNFQPNTNKETNGKISSERHPDRPPTTYENSFESTHTSELNSEMSPQMHRGNKSTGLSENNFKVDKVEGRHPNIAPTIYESSFAHPQDTEEVGNYPGNKTTGSDSPATNYEHSFHRTEMMTANKDSNPNTRPQNENSGSPDFSYEEHAPFHPDSPPTVTYQQSLDHTRKTNGQSYPRMNPDNQTTESLDYKFIDHVTYDPDSPMSTYEHPINSTQRTTDDKYVDPDEPKETGTGPNINEWATPFEEDGTYRHPESPPNPYEHIINSTQTPRNEKYIDPDEFTEGPVWV